MARSREMAADTSSSVAANVRSTSVSSVTSVDSVMICMKSQGA